MRATQDGEINESFETNPASAELRRFPGEIHLILGKGPPAKNLSFCYKRAKDTRIVPLVYWTYDGENETLPYFTDPTSRTDPAAERMCLELESKEFGTLKNAEGRFEIVVLFAEMKTVQK
ncbi:MAG: hypothetical protein ACXVCH_04330 [Bdellovibrionota bacterium]